MPKNGSEWHSIRQGKLLKLDRLKNYSNSLKAIIKMMMSPRHEDRPSAHDLLNSFLPSEAELELKWEKSQNQHLRDRVEELENKLRLTRKKSL